MIHQNDITRFWKYVQKSDGCWLWSGAVLLPPAYPYGRFAYFGGVHVYAHRFSWHLHNGPIPDGMMVLHRCDVPGCVNPGHLFLGTTQDNMTDKMNKGRHVTSPGEKNGMAKLTRKEVKQIRYMYQSGRWLQREIGEIFGVGNKAISKIITGIRW